MVARKDLVGADLFRGAMGYCVCVVSGVRTNSPREKGTHTNFIGGGQRRYFDLGGEEVTFAACMIMIVCNANVRSGDENIEAHERGAQTPIRSVCRSHSRCL